MVEMQKVGPNIKLSRRMKYFIHDVRFKMYHRRTFLRMEATGCSQLVHEQPPEKKLQRILRVVSHVRKKFV
jgi:hypothetical protein